MSELSPSFSDEDVQSNSLLSLGEGVNPSDINVLIVDDDHDIADLTSTFLTREKPRFEVRTENSVQDGLEYIDDIDAIVSDYDMPNQDGLDFLEIVREEYPELPFILFTGRGSENIASEAISKGVTDYLQKGSGSSKYSVLANRINNAVERHRAMKTLKHSERRFSQLVKNSSDVISIVNENAQFSYVSPSAEQVLGYDSEELLGESIFSFAHPDDRQHAMERFFEAIEDTSTEPVVQFRFKDPDRTWPVLESRGQNLLDNEFVNGFIINSRDITELKSREQKLKQHNEQLKDIKETLSQGLQDPISVASGALELYQSSGDQSHLEQIEGSLVRIETLVEQILELSKQGEETIEVEELSLQNAAADAWSTISTNGSKLNCMDSKQFKADPNRIQQLLKSLFSNAIEHNTECVTISVETTNSSIFIEDDGSGVTDEDQELIFDPGYTTKKGQTGFGLTIAQQVALSHGWEITADTGENGGLQFDITGITFKPKTFD